MLPKLRHIVFSAIDFFHKPFEGLFSRQTFSYLACGGFNTVLSIFLSWFCLHFIVPKKLDIFGMEIHDYIQAYIISFCVSFPLGFGLSKYIVFPESNLGGRIQIFRYAVLVGACVLLNYVLLKFFVGLCGFWPTPSYVFSAIIVAVFSFISQRKFTFQVKNIEEEVILPD